MTMRSAKENWASNETKPIVYGDDQAMTEEKMSMGAQISGLIPKLVKLYTALEKRYGAKLLQPEFCWDYGALFCSAFSRWPSTYA